MKKDKTIGIDLGTSNSVVSCTNENGETIVIPNSEGKKTTPSIVYFNGTDFEVGTKEAVNKYKLGNPNTVGEFKINMGTSKQYEIGDKKMTAKDLSAEVLRYLKKCAEDYFGEEVKDVVITVPAYFKDIQRMHTKEAAESIGFNVKRIINEPTASALAYGLDLKEEQNILVYDFGGGTFDVSLLTVGNDVVEVIGTKGDNRLGGKDIDTLIANTIARSLKKRQNYTPANEQCVRVIQELARDTKEKLTSNEHVQINVNLLANVDKNFDTSHGNLEISRADFNQIIKKILIRTVEILQKTVTEASMTMDEIDKIILVGGSTKSPIIRKMVEEITKRPVVQNEVDPDLIVGVGASIQASIISGDITDMVLVDVTPFNLSVEVVGGLTSDIIKANSSIPLEKSKTYTTSLDNQEVIVFNVYQGNAKIAQENEFLGSVTVTGIRKAKAGSPQIEVTFSIDANGQLKIVALDIETQKKVETTRQISLKSE